jgi:hypothetical protein
MEPEICVPHNEKERKNVRALECYFDELYYW